MAVVAEVCEDRRTLISETEGRFERKYQSDRARKHSALLLLPEEGFHTTVILDSRAGSGVDQHGDNVLVAHTGSEGQDVLPWWPVAKNTALRM